MLKKVVKMKEEDTSVLEMCRKCYSCKMVNDHTFERPEYFLENEVDEKIVRFIQCPDCSEEAINVLDMEFV